MPCPRTPAASQCLLRPRKAVGPCQAWPWCCRGHLGRTGMAVGKRPGAVGVGTRPGGSCIGGVRLIAQAGPALLRRLAPGRPRLLCVGLRIGCECRCSVCVQVHAGADTEDVAGESVQEGVAGVCRRRHRQGEVRCIRPSFDARQGGIAQAWCPACRCPVPQLVGS